MKPNKLTLVAAALICCVACTAKPVKRPDSFNFQRGMEAWNAEQYAEALDYFNQELKDNPQSSYAYGMIAVIWNGEEEYGKALAAANAAVRYCPKKDAEWMGIIYSTRADIHACLEDTTAAISDYTQAIKSDPKRYTYYNERGDLYFELKQYDLSDADFRVMLNSDESKDVRNGLMGLGRNQLRQGKADKALPLFNRVIQMHTDDAVAYSWRAECYMELAKFNEATDDLVTALRIDDDNKAFYLMRHLDNEQGFTLMRLKIKKEQGKNPNSGRWFYYEGRLCESNSRYHEAIEAYKQAGKIDAIAVEDDIADCYSELGDYDKAMHYYELALSNDSTNERVKLLYMDACGNSGNCTKAIGIANALIEQYPDVAAFYNLRGWWESDNGQYAAAIEDFTMTVILDSAATEAYLNRGRCYIKTGQTGLARADFEKFIALSDSVNNGSCGALAYLGRKDEALECMRKSVHKDSADYYYVAACIHSILNEKAPALQNLERALQLGFHSFAHIEVHLDFDNIRNTREFRTIVDKYRQKHLKSLQPDDNSASQPAEQRVVEVPFSKANGVTKVDCTINNLPLNFIFDTGASDVTLSQVEADFMLKNGYLNDKDVVGSQRYQTADGNISVGTVINLRRIHFGGLELNNIRASVVKSQNAPLLLGQSVLQRLGKIEIDNERQVLKITTK